MAKKKDAGAAPAINIGSQISSTLRCAPRSNRRLDWTRFRGSSGWGCECKARRTARAQGTVAGQFHVALRAMAWDARNVALRTHALIRRNFGHESDTAVHKDNQVVNIR
jgi:hypothetical protein